MLWLIFTALAQASCGVYEFKGTPRIVGGQLLLLIAESARSEKVFTTDASEQAKLAPFLDREVQGEFQLLAVQGPKEAIASEFVSLEDSAHDPLNPHHQTYLRLKEARPCP
ncbi:MAG: hypothetical protein ACLGG7_11520 [Bacteriovoracia bacterium]